MLLDEFISLTDDGLRAAYEAKPVDNTAVRKPFIKSLNTAIDQFENGRTKAPNRMWTVNADTVHFVPKFKGQPVAIAGKTEHYLPSSRFADAVKKIIAAVEAGELDEVLSGDAVAPAKASKAAATRAAGGDALSGIRKAFGIRMGKQGASAEEAAAAIKASGKYSANDVDAVLLEKSKG